MIDWKKLSYVAIKKKWRKFIVMRNIKTESAKTGKWHLTCMEREKMIENLILRLDDEMKKNFNISIGK